MLTATLFLLATQAKNAPAYIPAQTKVAILPVLNLSGDKYEDMKKAQSKEGDETLKRLFTERGFQIIAQSEVEKAITDSKIDLNDEENHRKDPLYAIGKAAGAKLVVFSVVTRTWQKTTDDFLMSKLEGFAAMKTWVLDVDATKAILSGASIEGRSTRNGPTGSLRQIRAVRLGLEKQLDEFLKPYPKEKTKDK